MMTTKLPAARWFLDGQNFRLRSGRHNLFYTTAVGDSVQHILRLRWCARELLVGYDPTEIYTFQNIENRSRRPTCHGSLITG